MFVVAMGILALAGLLQASTRYSKMSELRSTATLLANDIADRIRANSDGRPARRRRATTSPMQGVSHRHRAGRTRRAPARRRA